MYFSYCNKWNAKLDHGDSTAFIGLYQSSEVKLHHLFHMNPATMTAFS